jgi:hypothetical protein
LTIVFLDFDGVLHPYAPWPHDEVVQARYFAFLPRFERVIRDFPNVRIVVASDWRLHHTFQALREFFSPDIRARVIGTTALERPTSDAPGQRQLQAEQFLRDRGLLGTPWIAVDDTSTNYEPDAGLVLCRDCFGADEEAHLRELLTRLSRLPEREPQKL